MPYLHFKTTLTLSEEEKKRLALSIMECVKLLPGKPAQRAMIHIDDACEIFRDGEFAECAFMETQFQRPIEMNDQKNYIEALYSLFQKQLGLSIPQVYMSMIDLDTWGSRGTLH
ncbi:MAG: phenylpyruvate tautomerase MIF-related protein [Oscillospiraceae bacterium]|nr:phenylpyruvate tautomerase MIF-related protein [Oscillospiraceae bacterium]